MIVPVTFLVIVVTVIVYGITASPMAMFLKVAQSKPQGILFVGAHKWARSLARVLMNKKINIVMVDTNKANISSARMEGIPAFLGSILSEHITEVLNLDGIGRLMALTPNDEANSLASLHMSDEFERGEMYQLPPLSEKSGKEPDFSPKHLRARFLFGEGINYYYLNSLFMQNWIIKTTNLSEEFTYDDMRKHYNEKIIPFFLITENGKLFISTLEDPIKPKPGDTVIALVQDNE